MGRAERVVLALVILGFVGLVGFGLIVVVVCLVRPALVKVKAVVWKIFTLDIEIKSPEQRTPDGKPLGSGREDSVGYHGPRDAVRSELTGERRGWFMSIRSRHREKHPEPLEDLLANGCLCPCRSLLTSVFAGQHSAPVAMPPKH